LPVTTAIHVPAHKENKNSFQIMALKNSIELIVGYIQENCRVCDEVSRRNTGMIFMIFALV